MSCHSSEKHLLIKDNSSLSSDVMPLTSKQGNCEYHRSSNMDS